MYIAKQNTTLWRLQRELNTPKHCMHDVASKPIALNNIRAARQLQVRATASTEPANPSPNKDVQKVPLSELPKPHPKAMKTLNKSQTKTGTSKLLVDTLASVSFTIIGDDSELNWAVAQGLANRLGYFPVRTSKIMQGIMKVNSLEEVLQHAGSEQLVQAESEVLHGLRNQARVIASTLGGGAAGHQETYKDLWGSFIVWVDEEDKTAPKRKTPERQVHATSAEIQLKIKKQRGFAGANASAEQKAKQAVDTLIPQLVDFINAFQDKIQKKKQYVQYGCRGDWPEVMPESWSPVLQSFDRKPLEVPAEQQQQQ